MAKVPNDAIEVHGWLDRAIIGVALVALAAGFGQFGAVAALGDVAKSFGHLGSGATFADQAGLSGTTLGIGLAILRLASLGALVVTGIADRFGRRRTLLWSVGLGLVVTVVAAASPTYWWFVAIFAVGRPFLSTAAALSQVVAAELTATSDRARAVALVAAGYGIGSGLTAVIHGLAGSTLGFRGVFVLALVPLALVPVLSRLIIEPDRYAIAQRDPDHPAPVLGAIGGSQRKRLAVVGAITFALALTTGPATGFVYLYAENVRHLSGDVVAAMVVVAGAFGLCGLITGRLFTDRVGRRPAAAAAMATIAATGMLTYSGSRLALVLGYVLGVFCSSNIAPAAGALVNELFPTSVRASVAGWLVVASVAGAVVGLLLFGSLAEDGARFSLAAVVTFACTLPAIGLFVLLPETRGREPEEIAREH